MGRKRSFPLSTLVYNLDHRLTGVQNPRTAGTSFPVASRLFKLISLEANPEEFTSFMVEIEASYLRVEQYLVEQKRSSELIRLESPKELAGNVHLPSDDRFQGEFYVIVYISEEEMRTLDPQNLTFSFFVQRLRRFFSYLSSAY